MSIFTDLRPLVPQVRAEGLEPTLLAEQGPKPCASASFATPAAKPSRYRTGRSTVTTDGICRLSARRDPVLRRAAGRQLAGILVGATKRCTKRPCEARCWPCSTSSPRTVRSTFSDRIAMCALRRTRRPTRITLLRTASRRAVPVSTCSTRRRGWLPAPATTTWQPINWIDSVQRSATTTSAARSWRSPIGCDARDWSSRRSSALKTAPRGYAKDHPRIDLLRLKGLVAARAIGQPAKWMQTKAVVDRVRDTWDAVAPDERVARRPRRAVDDRSRRGRARPLRPAVVSGHRDPHQRELGHLHVGALEADGHRRDVLGVPIHLASMSVTSCDSSASRSSSWRCRPSSLFSAASRRSPAAAVRVAPSGGTAGLAEDRAEHSAAAAPDLRAGRRESSRPSTGLPRSGDLCVGCSSTSARSSAAWICVCSRVTLSSYFVAQ